MRLQMRLASPEASSKGASTRSIAWSKWVVRGGVEPPTFRFSEGLSRPVTAGPGDITGPSDQHMGLSEGYGAILTAVSAIPRNAVSSVLSECYTSGGPDLCCSCVGARTLVPLSSGDIGPDPRGV